MHSKEKTAFINVTFIPVGTYDLFYCLKNGRHNLSIISSIFGTHDGKGWWEKKRLCIEKQAVALLPQIVDFTKYLVQKT